MLRRHGPHAGVHGVERVAELERQHRAAVRVLLAYAPTGAGEVAEPELRLVAHPVAVEVSGTEGDGDAQGQSFLPVRVFIVLR